ADHADRGHGVFVGPDWRVAGPLVVEFDIHMPLKTEDEEPEVALDVLAQGLSIEVPEFRMRVDDISGRMSYTHPMDISGKNVHARFLDGELVVDIASTVDPASARLTSMDFEIEGTIPVERAGAWLDQPLLDVIEGSVAFTGALRFDLKDGARSRLELQSNLEGVEVDMPAPLGKGARERRPLHLTMALGGESEQLDLIYGPDVRSRFMLKDGRVMSGTVGVSGPMPEVRQGALRVAGSVHRLSVEDWFLFLQGRDDTGRFPEVTVDGLQVDRLTYGDFHFEDVKLIFGHAGDLTWVELMNPQIEGSIAFPAGDALPYVNLDFLRLSGSGIVGDPWASWNPAELPEFECNLNEITIDGEPWGNWAFKVLHVPGGVTVQDLKAQLRGVKIAGVPREEGPESPGARVIWRLTPEGTTTEFEGRLEGENLGAILEAFDFAPSIESKSVWADASVYWNGSPAAFSLVRLGGAMDVNARNGRIVDADTGTRPLKVMGIFDFASIARRARFDFSDVFGKGLAFNLVQGELHFDEGHVLLESPLEVKGPGSAIRVMGTVDLETGALDNEMIVTLPVGRTLPWYAAYTVLAANPLAGAGVIVAQRLLKSQLEQLASAKYTVTGTLEEPEVNFVEMFNTEMSGPSDEDDDDDETESGADEETRTGGADTGVNEGTDGGEQ
ncbi:MAG: AsmA-like C-terminal region-containing protein, partial [Gammaproteobacteria bacterium]